VAVFFLHYLHIVIFLLQILFLFRVFDGHVVKFCPSLGRRFVLVRLADGYVFHLALFIVIRDNGCLIFVFVGEDREFWFVLVCFVLFCFTFTSHGVHLSVLSIYNVCGFKYTPILFKKDGPNSKRAIARKYKH
jgi:hypothetical protein